MKECRYCGTKYDDSLDICPNCGGNKVITEEDRAEEAALRQKEAENQERAAAAPVKKKNTIIGVIVAVVVVIAAIAGFSIYKANQPLSNGMTKDEAQGVFDSGVAFMDAGQYEDAIDTFLQLPSDSKQYAEARELLAQSQDSYRADIISRVDSQVANGDYDSAFSLIEKAQAIIPGDAELQGAYDNTYAAYRTAVLAKADEYSQSGQYKMALEYLAGVQTTFADDAQIRDAYDNINLAYKDEVRTTALTDADNYVASADYVSAINTLNSAVSEIGQDEEVTAKLNIISNDYATSVIDAAKAQYVEYDANSIFAAEDKLGQALDVLPNNSSLSSELKWYREKEPVDILTPQLERYYDTEDDMEFVGEVSDNRGTLYSNAIHLSYITGVKTDYQYSRLAGKFFYAQEYASSPEVFELEVYGYNGDALPYRDSLIWSGKISGNSDPLNIDIDISGWKWVYFCYHDFDGDYEYHCYMADMYLWK